MLICPETTITLPVQSWDSDTGRRGGKTHWERNPSEEKGQQLKDNFFIETHIAMWFHSMQIEIFELK